VHSFLEGLGVGGLDTAPGLVSFLVGIASHKWLEAFALGLAVLQADFPPGLALILNLFYAALTPLGMAVGMALVAFVGPDSPSASTLELVLNGLATGSFLFVSCVEMIPPEFAEIGPASKYKFATVILGFSMMAILTLIEGV
jgi:zinc transporter 1/2/3